jgi:hypothetical protein
MIVLVAVNTSLYSGRMEQHPLLSGQAHAPCSARVSITDEECCISQLHYLRLFPYVLVCITS